TKVAKRLFVICTRTDSAICDLVVDLIQRLTVALWLRFQPRDQLLQERSPEVAGLVCPQIIRKDVICALVRFFLLLISLSFKCLFCHLNDGGFTGSPASLKPDGTCFAIKRADQSRE